VLGGLHVTSLPDEAAAHADHIFLGPGEDTWPQFLDDLRQGTPALRYVSHERNLATIPPIRRDLIKRHLYLVPNSIVVSRGCPHVCDFCYKVAFFQGGKQFYTMEVDRALAEIDRLPGRHLYFLDDHLFGNPNFAAALFDGMAGKGRLWQAAGTVKSVLEQPVVLEKAVRSGLRSLFVGFETVNSANLHDQRKYQNIGRDYAEAIRRLHDLGVMVNGSFVFGMDHDGPDVFDRTVEWAVERGIETATYHILTPYPDTALYRRMDADNRVLHHNWDLFDTRHVVFKPQRLTAQELEAGYWRAYRDFYRWGSIWRGASSKTGLRSRLRHMAYSGGWKKFEPLWDLLIRSKQVLHALPVLETILTGFGSSPARSGTEEFDQDRGKRLGVNVVGLAVQDAQPGAGDDLAQGLGRLQHERSTVASTHDEGRHMDTGNAFGRDDLVPHDAHVVIGKGRGDRLHPGPERRVPHAFDLRRGHADDRHE
jgi:radical SAM superfamily enzyme YgiQ (UPF0313 family)